MDDFSARPPSDRLTRLSVDREPRVVINRKYTALVRLFRYVLPFLAVVMTVIVLTWDEAGRRMKPMTEDEVTPKSKKIQSELLKPVFNSVDDENQPYTVMADRAIQNRENPDLVELENPVATLTKNDGGKIDAAARTGLYAQQSRKLNLEVAVSVKDSDYTLSTEELRVDVVAQRAYSGRDVHIEGPAGTLDATGLEGNLSSGAIIFTGPARIVLYSDGNLLFHERKNP